MWAMRRTAFEWRSFRRIGAVLVRHGLGWLAEAAGVPRFLRRATRPLAQPVPLPPYAVLGQRLRRALEELGPTFVLLGRYLSTRLDLLPDALCQELALLPPAGPEVPPEQVAAILREELGKPPETLFAAFDCSPRRRSWTEQVHAARTSDGREVWVHVPNPEIQARWQEELPQLLALAERIDQRLGRRWRIGETVYEFVLSVRQEMDAAEQARNVERWRGAFPEHEFAVPEVDPIRSSSRVLTHSALQGEALPTAVVEHPEEADQLTERFYGFWGRAIFELGLYPAPPALGAPVRLADGRLGLTAFAPVGHLDTFARRLLAQLLREIGKERMESVLSLGAELGFLDRYLRSTTALQAVRHLSERYRGLPANEVRLEAVARDLFALADRQLVLLPERFRLLLCTLIAIERYGERLSPRVSAASCLARSLEEARTREGRWPAYRGQLVQAGRGWLEMLSSLPESLRHLLARAAQDDLLVGVELEGWQRPMRRLERMVLRLVLAVLCAGMAFAWALLVTAMLPGPWRPWGWLAASLTLLLVAGLILFLLITFFRQSLR